MSYNTYMLLLRLVERVTALILGGIMNNVESCLEDLMILFSLDLLNEFELIDNSVVVTMEDGSKVRVKVKQLA